MEKAKEIISHFLKISSSDIVESTIIDNTAIEGSIFLLRMYSKLAQSGYIVKDPVSLTTYGDFLQALGKSPALSDDEVNEVAEIRADEEVKNHFDNLLSVGVDVEDISNLPVSSDFIKEQFYIDNFSSKEIKYCESKKSPMKSFAALFSLKEAIVKADNSFKEVKFNKINIEHNKQGKPIFGDFNLSTSHSNNLVVSIALKNVSLLKLSHIKNDDAETVRVENEINESEERHSFTKTQILLIIAIVVLPLYLFLIISQN